MAHLQTFGHAYIGTCTETQNARFTEAKWLHAAFWCISGPVGTALGRGIPWQLNVQSPRTMSPRSGVGPQLPASSLLPRPYI